MIFPIKVNEYLAAGKPAIGTPITTLLQYGDVVEVADSTEKWIAAIKSCLQNGSEEEEVRKRKRVARNYDWNELVKQIAHHLRRVADDQR